jgi:hypothetical protein
MPADQEFSLSDSGVRVFIACAPKKLGHCPRLLATRVRKDWWSGRRELIKTLACEFPFGLLGDGVETLAVQALSLISLNPLCAQRVTR